MDVLGPVTGVGGEFRRDVDGTDGMDMGECSTIDFSRCLFFVITEVYEGTRACGKHRGGCGDPRRIRIWYLLLTYIPVSTVSLVFQLDEVRKSDRMNEV